MTLQVLADAGIHHDWAVSEPIETSLIREFEYVITLCDDARAVCPTFPGTDRSMRWDYRDPSRTPGDDAARLAADKRVSTDLGGRVRQLVTIAERQDRLGSA
jgi:protein-tyrosine-phosphatase